MDVYQLLESEAHHHKISPVGTGRLIAMVGTTDPDHQGSTNLQVLFGLVLTIIPRTTKNKNELPAARIHRQCNPKAIEVAFLSVPAIEFFAEEQLQVLHERYLREGQGRLPMRPSTPDGGSSHRSRSAKDFVPEIFFAQKQDSEFFADVQLKER